MQQRHRPHSTGQEDLYGKISLKEEILRDSRIKYIKNGLEILLSAPILKNISVEVLMTVLIKGKQVVYRYNQIVYDIGDKPDKLFIIVKGSIKLQIRTAGVMDDPDISQKYRMSKGVERVMESLSRKASRLGVNPVTIEQSFDLGVDLAKEPRSLPKFYDVVVLQQGQTLGDRMLLSHEVSKERAVSSTHETVLMEIGFSELNQILMEKNKAIIKENQKNLRQQLDSLYNMQKYYLKSRAFDCFQNDQEASRLKVNSIPSSKNKRGSPNGIETNQNTTGMNNESVKSRFSSIKYFKDRNSLTSKHNKNTADSRLDDTDQFFKNSEKQENGFGKNLDSFTLYKGASKQSNKTKKKGLWSVPFETNRSLVNNNFHRTEQQRSSDSLVGIEKKDETFKTFDISKFIVSKLKKNHQEMNISSKIANKIVVDRSLEFQKDIVLEKEIQDNKAKMRSESEDQNNNKKQKFSSRLSPKSSSKDVQLGIFGKKAAIFNLTSPKLSNYDPQNSDSRVNSNEDKKPQFSTIYSPLNQNGFQPISAVPSKINLQCSLFTSRHNSSNLTLHSNRDKTLPSTESHLAYYRNKYSIERTRGRWNKVQPLKNTCMHTNMYNVTIKERRGDDKTSQKEV